MQEIAICKKLRYDFLSPASRESPDTDERTDILESLVLAADFAFRSTTLVLFHWENEHFTLRLLAQSKTKFDER